MITEKVLLSIKDRIRKFFHVVEPISQLWHIPHYTLISVMVQNLAATGKGCKNYSFEDERDELLKIQKSLRSIANYYNSHFESWVSDEIDMIIMGEDHNDDIENGI